MSRRWYIALQRETEQRCAKEVARGEKLLRGFVVLQVRLDSNSLPQPIHCRDLQRAERSFRGGGGSGAEHRVGEDGDSDGTERGDRVPVTLTPRCRREPVSAVQLQGV